MSHNEKKYEFWFVMAWKKRRTQLREMVFYKNIHILINHNYKFGNFVDTFLRGSKE
jgi:hypothetical protein